MPHDPSPPPPKGAIKVSSLDGLAPIGLLPEDPWILADAGIQVYYWEGSTPYGWIRKYAVPSGVAAMLEQVNAPPPGLSDLSRVECMHHFFPPIGVPSIRPDYPLEFETSEEKSAFDEMTERLEKLRKP